MVIKIELNPDGSYKVTVGKTVMNLQRIEMIKVRNAINMEINK